MEVFFQSFYPVARAIESLMKEGKIVKISLLENVFYFSLVLDWEKEEIEKSAMEFFLFLKKKLISLDISELSMGEREALLNTISIFESYIETYLKKDSNVLKLLKNELFSLKLGGMISRQYLSENHEDLLFIRKNSLEDFFFYHGICLHFHPIYGICFPMKADNDIVREVFFRDLKRFDLEFIQKFYYNGQYYFSLDAEGLFLDHPKIVDKALVSIAKHAPFVKYQSGYPKPSFELYHRSNDFFIIIHDGEGALYRYGIDEKKLISPDKYAYKKIDDFEKIIIPSNYRNIYGCLETLKNFDFETKEDLIEKLLTLLEVKTDCISYLASRNKMLSFLYLPKLLFFVFRGKISMKRLLKPWAIKQVDLKKLGKTGELLRKKLA